MLVRKHNVLIYKKSLSYKKMDLLNQSEIESIVIKSGYKNFQCLTWSIENYSSEVIGYLGEHLKLTVEIKTQGVIKELNLFIKCIPRFDKWKAEYLRETTFFRKEHAMLNGLFKNFREDQGEKKWRPTLLYIKEELFVFEDVSKQGYVMPDHVKTLTEEELMASVETLARFHAQSYIYEENKSKELGRQYRIWEDYGEYLTEPSKDQPWRDTGKQAAIDYLKEYSTYKERPNFCDSVKTIMSTLFECAAYLKQPSSLYRNVVIHRDLWTNNIFIKKLDNGKLHALFVDFQTVLYCSPMLDLSSLLFFNTTKNFRHAKTNDVIDFYYAVLGEELKANDIDVSIIFSKDELNRAYQDSIIFAVTQAALIVPIMTMNPDRKKEIYGNREKALKINVISRSEEFIETAKEDTNYRNRVTELLDDILERFVYPSSNIQCENTENIET